MQYERRRLTEETAGMNHRSLVQTLSVILLLAFLGYVIADAGMLYLRGTLYPVQPPPARRLVNHANAPRGSSYGVITSRNIFNADQKIPSKVGASEDGGKKNQDGPPVPSSLPIQLIGTIVHVDPKRSVASLQLKGGKQEQVSVRVDGTIPEGLAVVTKIERSKITFRNSQSGRLEYIEMKEASKLSFAAGKPVQQGEVTKLSDTDFSLKRADIDKQLSNLPDLLQQARAVPRMGPNGQVECFSLADISPGSIYERLGLKRGDCIKSVNGEKIDSPAKAMEMFNALRGNASAIGLGIERDGRDNNFNYSIQ